MRFAILVLLAPLLATRAHAIDLGAQPQNQGLRELQEGKAALDSTDQRLDSRLRTLHGLAPNGRLRPGPRGGPAWSRQGRLHVQVRVQVLDDATRSALGRAGLTIEREDVANGLVEGWVPAASVRAVAGLDAVSSVRPVERGHTRIGSVTSAGDAASRANQVRALGIDGTGVTVGVISDGLDSLAASQASGDLAGVSVPGGCSAGSGAEGTAILGIVHDLAPGASLLFASGVTSSLSFDQAVNCLADAGAKVIVDDLQFFDEPYFEDGTVAQSVRAAVQRGVSFHSAAGNSGQLHYEGVFQPSPNSKFHDFNTSGAIDNTNGVLLPPGGSLLCVLQWDDPFGAASDDYDLFLLDGASPPNVITASQDVQNGRGDPIEIISANNPGSGPEVAFVAIQRQSGAARTLELFCAQDVQQMEHFTSTGAIFGHAGIPEAVAVGALDVASPGLDTVEFFSSQGPARIEFPSAQTRPKPDLVGYDDVASEVPGFNPFFGTSAAAPHVAAVAALLLQENPTLTPARVQSVLRASAIDVGPPGFDNDSGAGRLDALGAASLACDDGNPCNGVETFVAGRGCVPGTPPPDGTSCGDGNVCNGEEACHGGACVTGPPLVCDDGDPCTQNLCDPTTGCRFPTVEGVVAVSCALDVGLPGCAGSDLPRGIQRRFARAQRLVSRAEQATKRSKQRKLLRQAARSLKGALAIVSRSQRRGTLDEACGVSLAQTLGEARDRAQAVAASL
jgi:subtilisin family serine protease